MIDDDRKARAMALLAIGTSAHKVADDLEIPRTTVRRWRDQALRMSNKNGPLKKEKIGDQVFAYMEESIDTQRGLLRAISEPERLMQMSAKDLAKVHGDMFENTMRLLQGMSKEAFER